MRRVTVFNRSGEFAAELDPSRVFGLTRKGAINGEHSLTIVTSIGLEKGQRVMVQDDRGYWREFVIYGADVTHDSAGAPIGTYYCVWSLQADLMGTRVDAMPGAQNPVSAATALDAVLENTSRWARGTVTNTNTGGASMYDTDGWDALSILVRTWGGEVDATIQADGFGITARKVDLYSQQGDQDAKRRFDFGEDLASVRRTIADGPLYCRVTPRGAGEQTDEGGYGRKITIESVNDGKDYLEDAGMVDIAKLPDGQGGWEYPTVEIENSECKEPADLKAWAQSVMEDYTRPKVTYAVDVLQIAREGIDMQGVSLGDAVQIVDRKLGGLRTTARVLEMTVDELSGKSVALTLGDMREGLSSLFGTISAQLATVSDTVQVMNGGTFATADYLSNLLGRLNTQINGTGGYTYITEGDGIRCYDAAVSDPMVGAEASAAVEIKGGTIRIANTKTAQGAWEWKTVFTSGHIAADLVTAAKITAGYIGSVNSGAYWDLDNNALTVGAGSIHGGTLTMGGASNVNGIIHVLDESGNVICEFDNEGADIQGKLKVVGDAKDTNFKTVMESGSIKLTDPLGLINGTTTEQTLYGLAFRRDYMRNYSIPTIVDYNKLYIVPHSHQTSSPNPISKDKCSILSEQALFLLGNCKDLSSYEPYIELNVRPRIGCKNGTYHGYYEVDASEFNWYSTRAGSVNVVMNLLAGGTMANNTLHVYGKAYANSWNTNSDRRLKKHIEYLGDKAVDFVRSLKPALFDMYGERKLGFYAQDVQESDQWETVTVQEAEFDAKRGFSPLALDYQQLIAPLVAYTQKLEQRLDELEARIAQLE